MRKLSLLSIGLLLFGISPAANEPVDGLAALGFLVGSCWEGKFADSEQVDTHCYTSFYDGAFIRDRHEISGGDSAYRGETIYHWDAKAIRIAYRYWNSQGGVSDGYGDAAGGRVNFPGEKHVRDDGSVVEYQSVIERTGPDQYVSIAEQLTESGWQEAWRIEFVRVGPAT